MELLGSVGRGARGRGSVVLRRSRSVVVDYAVRLVVRQDEGMRILIGHFDCRRGS